MLNDRYPPLLVFWGSALKIRTRGYRHLEHFRLLRPLIIDVLDGHTALRLVHQHHIGASSGVVTVGGGTFWD